MTTVIRNLNGVLGYLLPACLAIALLACPAQFLFAIPAFFEQTS
jgi:hypothetical protein